MENGIGVLWTIIASVDNTTGASAVHIDPGMVAMTSVPAAWVQCQSPVIPFSGGGGHAASVITIAAGAWQQFQITGAFLYQGTHAPTIVGVPKVQLRTGESALFHLQCFGWYVPIISGPNPGGSLFNLQNVNQIFE